MIQILVFRDQNRRQNNKKEKFNCQPETQKPSNKNIFEWHSKWAVKVTQLGEYFEGILWYFVKYFFSFFAWEMSTRKNEFKETQKCHKHERDGKEKVEELYSIKSKFLLEIDCFIIEHLGYQFDKEI